MDSVKAEGTRYKIEMKICEPKTMSERGDWFAPDSSKIDFASLKPVDITCKEYIETEKTDEKTAFNQFKFANQVFAWEKILVFKISNASSRGWQPEMYIVLPIKHKAFATYISLNGIEFQSGQVMFLSHNTMKKQGMSLSIEQSLKDHKTEEIKNYSLRELLEGK